MCTERSTNRGGLRRDSDITESIKLHSQIPKQPQTTHGAVNLMPTFSGRNKPPLRIEPHRFKSVVEQEVKRVVKSSLTLNFWNTWEYAAARPVCPLARPPCLLPCAKMHKRGVWDEGAKRKAKERGNKPAGVMKQFFTWRWNENEVKGREGEGMKDEQVGEWHKRNCMPTDGSWFLPFSLR